MLWNHRAPSVWGTGNSLPSRRQCGKESRKLLTPVSQLSASQTKAQKISPSSWWDAFALTESWQLCTPPALKHPIACVSVCVCVCAHLNPSSSSKIWRHLLSIPLITKLKKTTSPHLVLRSYQRPTSPPCIAEQVICLGVQCKGVFSARFCSTRTSCFWDLGRDKISITWDESQHLIQENWQGTGLV